MKEKQLLDIELPREVLEIWRFSIKELVRPQLAYINIKPDNKVGKSEFLHAITTDGYRMLHIKWPTHKEDVITSSWCIEGEAAQFLLNAHKRPSGRTADYSFRLTTEGTDLIIGTTVSGTHAGRVDQKYKADGDKIVYPPWEHVIPQLPNKSNRGPSAFCFNLQYLLDFQRYLKAIKVSEPLIKVYTSDPEGQSALIIHPSMGDSQFEIEYILMPARMD